MTIDAELYAIFSKVAYTSSQSALNTALNGTIYNVGWTVLSIDGGYDGMQAVAYGLDSDGDEIYEEIVIAYRGSDSGVDWGVSDLQIALGQVPSQLSDALAFYDLIEDEASTSDETTITITGHSLGGSLAEMIGALDDYKDVNVDTYNSYGTQHLLDDLSRQGEKLSSDYSNINNYGDGEDLVYRASDHIGNDHSVNSDTSDWDILDDTNNHGGDGLKNDHMFDNLKDKNLDDFDDEEIDDLGLNDLKDNSSNPKKGLKDHLKDLLRDLLGDDLLDDLKDLFDDAEKAPPVRYDPIVFDLNGDGVETTTVKNGVFFDYENDGFAEATGWVGYGDAILVKDKDLSGTIDNENELVTDLSHYDANGDGVINSNDDSDGVGSVVADGLTLSGGKSVNIIKFDFVTLNKGKVA